MKSSESIKELASALAKAQASMENASKDKDNPFFRSKYANLESVVGVIRPAIEPHGLSFIQVCHDWDVGAKVETIILHESGEWLSCGVMSAPAGRPIRPSSTRNGSPAHRWQGLRRSASGWMRRRMAELVPEATV